MTLTAIHIQTLFLAIIVVCLTFAISLGWAARKSHEGIDTWALALWVFTGAFSLLALREVVPDMPLRFVGNALLSTSLALFLIATRRFQERPDGAVSAFLPVLILVVGQPFLPRLFLPILVASNLVFLFQVGWVLARTWRFDYDFPSQGRYLVLVGFLILTAVLLSRLWAAFFQTGELRAFFAPSAVQALTFLGVLSGLVMASTGFMAMSKERSDARLRLAAMRDRLTGCWNRIRIEEIAEQEIARLRRYGYPVSAIMADLDHFKEINDRYGHIVGDEVLKSFTKITAETIRTTDLLGRWGGEEFIIILPMSDVGEAVAIAERLRRNVETYAFPHGIQMSASFGVAAGLAGDVWGDWLQRADTALYRAKASGRNCIKTEDLEIMPMHPHKGQTVMLQLVWRENYACGEPTIDRQHRGLFEATNKLLAFGGTDANQDEIIATLRMILDETRIHFADEERILAEAGYPEASEHARAHHELFARAELLLRRYTAGEISATAIFHFVIHELFSNHLQMDDQGYAYLFRPEERGKEETRVL